MINRLIANISISFLAFLVFSFQNKPHTYVITDFGAKGDGTTINTFAINKAISTCSENGGGTVLVPTGNYISGTIVLKSNVDFYLEAGSTITGSKDTADYLLIDDALFHEGYNRFGLLYASNAKNIFISGKGSFDGNGTFFVNGLDKPHMGRDYDRTFTRQGADFMKPGNRFEDGPVSYAYRPGLMVTILNCENVHITDVSFKDSPEWTIRIGDCEDVVIRGIRIINNPVIPNNDGIHCTSSRNILISDCYISAGDDAIIVSGFGNGPLPGEKFRNDLYGNKTGYAENVTVTNCVLSSRSACIRVGYGHHPIRNLIFSNLAMVQSNRGIGVFSRTNSSIENVLFSNITINTRIHSGHWWGKGEPIHISAVSDKDKGNAGRIKNIRFNNIIADAETGILVVGSKESLIEDVVFNQVQLTIRNGKYTRSFGGNFDLRPVFPVSSALFKHDIPGAFAQYVKNISFMDVQLVWEKDLAPFFTHGLEVDHFENCTISNSFFSPAFTGKPLYGIKLSNGRNAVTKENNRYGGTLLLKKEAVF